MAKRAAKELEGSRIVPHEEAPRLTTAALSTDNGWIVEGGQRWGVSFLDAIEEAVVTVEEFGLGKRDQGGNVTVKQTPRQLMPRIVYQVLQRFEGRASDWPVRMEPIPETTREPKDGPRDAAYLALVDFLNQCVWSRDTGIDLVLADSRAYLKADAAERALDRIEEAFGSLLTEHRLPPDREVMELRERVRCLTELVDEARTKGFVPKGQPG